MAPSAGIDLSRNSRSSVGIGAISLVHERHMLVGRSSLPPVNAAKPGPAYTPRSSVGRTPCQVNDERANGHKQAAVVGAICMVALASSVALSLAHGVEVFAAGSKIKALALPVDYAVILCCFLVERQERGRRSSISMVVLWAYALLLLLVCSIAASTLHSSTTSVLSLLQDIASLGMCAASAILIRSRTNVELLPWVKILAVTAVGLALLPQQAPPFASLIIPAVFALVLVRANLRRTWRALPWLLMAWIIYGLVRSGSAIPSGAQLLQYAVCITAFCYFKRPTRYPRSVAGAVTGVAVAVGLLFCLTPGRQLLGLAGDFQDVTIAQRQYEMQAVWAKVSSSTEMTIIGGGPGATVNLSQSPDVATLIAAGRDPVAVDDVHLLAAHLMLKFGVFGICWLILLLLSLTLMAVRVAESRSANSQALFMFLVGMFAFGIPAATNFLANPIFGVLFGVLAGTEPARRSTDASQSDVANWRLLDERSPRVISSDSWSRRKGPQGRSSRR